MSVLLNFLLLCSQIVSKSFPKVAKISLKIILHVGLEFRPSHLSRRQIVPTSHFLSSRDVTANARHVSNSDVRRFEFLVYRTEQCSNSSKFHAPENKTGTRAYDTRTNFLYQVLVRGTWIVCQGHKAKMETHQHHLSVQLLCSASIQQTAYITAACLPTHS